MINTYGVKKLCIHLTKSCLSDMYDVEKFSSPGNNFLITFYFHSELININSIYNLRVWHVISLAASCSELCLKPVFTSMYMCFRMFVLCLRWQLMCFTVVGHNPYPSNSQFTSNTFYAYFLFVL